ncbi:hypothetical protein [Demequina lutea]|uniref:ANTAR domain-containing protein n=1 Tax=Demequina lutea TaxID=431489 RepID=A0A7Y9ZCB6_9MICO|nr:hypothetical protein [Demequina lutea]NYI42769.1 hypothetical protein [Demequina lutea]
MHIASALQKDMRALTSALDRPNADLSQSLSRLTTSARSAVESFLGLSLLVPSAPGTGFRVFAAGADPDLARASLFLGLYEADPGAHEFATIGVVLYARTPGAFVDIAADALWLGMAGEVQLDAHLPVPTDPTPATYLQDESTINQALGVLVEGGATLDGARAGLGQRARSSHQTTASAARRVLDELKGT